MMAYPAATGVRAAAAGGVRPYVGLRAYSSVPATRASPPGVHRQESASAFSRPSSTSLAPVIVVEAVSKEIGSDLTGPSHTGQGWLRLSRTICLSLFNRL